MPRPSVRPTQVFRQNEKNFEKESREISRRPAQRTQHPPGMVKRSADKLAQRLPSTIVYSREARVARREVRVGHREQFAPQIKSAPCSSPRRRRGPKMATHFAAHHLVEGLTEHSAEIVGCAKIGAPPSPAVRPRSPLTLASLCCVNADPAACRPLVGCRGVLLCIPPSDRKRSRVARSNLFAVFGDRRRDERCDERRDERGATSGATSRVATARERQSCGR